MRFLDLVTRNIASPYGLVMASFLMFLFAWTFPPGIYSHYMAEPDLMFFDPVSLLFFLLCVLGFVFGLLLIRSFFPVRNFSRERIATRVSPMLFLLIPLVTGTVLSILSSILLLHSNVSLLELLLAAEGEQLKDVGAIEMIGTLGLASSGLMGIVWWASWRRHQLDLRGWRKSLVQLTIIVATGSMLVAATLRLGRGEFMPILLGAAILFLANKHSKGTLTAGYVLKFAVVFVGLVVALFGAFSALRGILDLRSLFVNLVGYTIAGYNRLAAILDGRLHYPFAGRGLYISSFASFNETFNKLIPINRLLSWPDFTTTWRSEFGAVSTAGLNGDLIWSGTFGYLFSDVGWLAPFLLFVYGLTTGWVWRSFKLGRTAGVVLYPWFAFCILFWFGTNYLLDTKAVVLLGDAIALRLYESLLMRTTTEAAPI